MIGSSAVKKIWEMHGEETRSSEENEVIDIPRSMV